MALSSMEAETKIFDCHRQKARGYYYLGPREDISHQAPSMLQICNLDCLCSWTVHISQEGNSLISAPSRRHRHSKDFALWCSQQTEWL